MVSRQRIVAEVWHGATENGPLNDAQIPNCRGVHVALGTGYSRVEGNRRASRNGRVSDRSPTRNPHFPVAVRRWAAEGWRTATDAFFSPMSALSVELLPTLG